MSKCWCHRRWIKRWKISHCDSHEAPTLSMLWRLLVQPKDKCDIGEQRSPFTRYPAWIVTKELIYKIPCMNCGKGAHLQDTLHELWQRSPFTRYPTWIVAKEPIYKIPCMNCDKGAHLQDTLHELWQRSPFTRYPAWITTKEPIYKIPCINCYKGAHLQDTLHELRQSIYRWGKVAISN